MLSALAEIRGGAWTSDAVARSLRDLPDDARADVAESIRSIVARTRWLDFALNRGDGLDGPALDRARVIAAWTLANVDAVPSIDAPSIDLEAITTAEVRLHDIGDPAERIATRWSLPTWFVARLIDAWGEASTIAFASALDARPPQTLRVNTLANSADELSTQLASFGVECARGKLAPDALRLTNPTNVFRLPGYAAGAFEVQDEGSQLIAEVVAPPPKSAVIDACAGAGGKTLHLAAMLAGRGKVFALDTPGASLDSGKLAELRRRARRAGASNIEVREDAASLRPVARVLVDAPCTGTGALRRNPDARGRLDEDMVARLCALQLDLLERWSSFVAPRGRLIYATCSVLTEENERVVEQFAAAHPEFDVVPVKEILGRARALTIGDGLYLRTRPDVHDTDGFFAAALRRR